MPTPPRLTLSAIGVVIYRDWMELDRLLTQPEESHSIRLKVVHSPPMGKNGSGLSSYAECLLPGVTKGGGPTWSVDDGRW